ncbi:MAG: 23S rRNA (pseudouridine(1915)-N(3))-methyltransferase RlmH, partial [Tepidanaerobacter acetatoxydans]|nr:23S rRNA (pseudouridine(1915)-N(3))-methyltransferase RlmH [Tepidanaerobacter acetatoxydans]
MIEDPFQRFPLQKVKDVLMNIDIICVGKIKEKYILDGIKEYKKRLTPYCKLRIIEAIEQKAPENLSEKEKAQVLEREGNSILQKLN